MPQLYIIAGCNGAGKTTASYTVLPEILHCKEFVNADNIALGLSPFNQEGVALEAGRIMLKRIKELLDDKTDFAFETTLSTKSYVPFINKAQLAGYKVTLLFFWLSSPKMAAERVAARVSKGGHNIPFDTIERRYFRGIKNLLNLYIPICDNWIIVDNRDMIPKLAVKGSKEGDKTIINNDIWSTLLKLANDIHR